MTGLVDFDALFRAEYAGLVRALSVTYTAEIAADAVQEAFIEADRRWDTVAQHDRPAAWIRRVALNRASNQRRNHRGRQAILRGITPVATADLTPELIDLRRALAALPDRQRLTICLHYLAGLPVAEVADALEVSPGTVKSNLHDGRKQLREMLEVGHG